MTEPNFAFQVGQTVIVSLPGPVDTYMPLARSIIGQETTITQRWGGWGDDKALYRIAADGGCYAWAEDELSACANHKLETCQCSVDILMSQGCQCGGK